MSFYFFTPKFAVRIFIAALSLAIFLNGLLPGFAFADTQSLVINEVQTGGIGTGNAGQEFIELKNTSAESTNVSGWKVVYSSSTDASKYTIVELQGEVIAGGFVLLVSNSYLVPGGVTPDLLFAYNSGMSGVGGHIKLVDNLNQERDRLGWGSAQFAETLPALAPDPGKSLQREGEDSDDNSKDFLVDSPTPSGGDLKPVTEPEPEPEPEPTEYLPITITELLPDPASPKLDSEDEFIELYNPNDEAVLLKDYVLQTGSSFQYSYKLPAFSIEPKKYMALYSSETNLTLSNTSSKARISDPNGKILFTTDEYNSVTENNAWGLFDESWQATNQPTPASANKASSIEQEIVESENDEEGPVPCPAGKFRNPATNRCKMIDSESGLKPCNPDQFRNPETNRCKKIETSNGLLPCLAGQYRNPETNRCRATASASSVLKPCNPDQVRNPATNRCKKKDSDSDLKPCAAGQERNPDTNRCRKVAGVSTTNPLATPAAAATTKTSVSYPAMIAVAALAVGYGVFEYRQEIKRRVLKIFSKSSSK